MERRFGANYTPSKNWWFSWTDWEESSIASDLSALRDLGLDHIRAHVLWPIFQPNEGYISGTAMDRLERLLDLCGERQLDVCVSVLDGWLSGFAFYPTWLDSRNPFTDPAAIDAQARLLTAIGERLRDHPAFWGLDLGNEPNVLIERNFPETTLMEADAWQRTLLAACEQAAPGKFHVNGIDHWPWFANRGFSREASAALGSASIVHAYIYFTNAMKQSAWDGPECTGLTGYMIELANAYALDPGRPVWVQETGASDLWMDSAHVPEFSKRTVASTFDCPNACAITWWCSHDLNPGLIGFHPLECGLGLFDNENRLKPVGRAFGEAIAYTRNAPEPEPKKVALLFDDEEIGQPCDPEGWNVAKRYFRAVKQGLRPALVLRSRAIDKAYLESRGIVDLLELP